MLLRNKELQKIFENAINPSTGEHIQDIVKELTKCKADIKYWINNYVKTKSSVGGMIPFELYPFQEKTVDDFVENRFNIVLKSRQMGISWLSAAFAAWYAIFYDSKEIGILANKQIAAQNMLQKVKDVIDYLPDWMKYALDVDEFQKRNDLSIVLKNKSTVVASSTTDDAFRGYTLSLLIVDEAAFIPDFEETWKSIFPTLIVGGRSIVLSTPAGQGNYYHKLYTDAEGGLNEFNAICLGWEQHPSRNDQWALEQIRAHGEKYFAQEFACQFLGSGDTLISAKWIAYIDAKWIREPTYKGSGDEFGIWYWKPPVVGHNYVIAADFASGNDDISQGEGSDKSKTDFNACVVFDLDGERDEYDDNDEKTGRKIPCVEQVAEYCGKMTTTKFADILLNFGIAYNNALVVWENNAGWSQTTENRFLEKQYYNVYREPKSPDKKGFNIYDVNNKAGIATTKRTRNAYTDKFSEAITTEEFIYYSKRLHNEVKTFEYNPKKDRYEATKSNHDDIVMSSCICLYVISQYLSHRDTTLADLALDGLRNSHGRNRGRASKSGLPSISVSNLSGQQIMNPAMLFTDRTTGENFADFVRTGKSPEQIERENSHIQKGIFDFPIDGSTPDDLALLAMLTPTIISMNKKS